MSDKSPLKDPSEGDTANQSPISKTSPRVSRTPTNIQRRSVTCNSWNGSSEIQGYQHLSRRHACDESFVEDVHLDFFYKPHSISALVLVLCACMYFAFSVEDEVDTRTRVWSGMLAACAVFLLCGVTSLPSGPFTRPHPAFWRLVLAISILYWLLCTVILFQSYEDVRIFLGVAFPELKPQKTSGPLPWGGDLDVALDGILSDEDCYFTVEKVFVRVDRFILAHFLGWFFKAVLIRSIVICLIAAIFWEITELFFAPILTNLYECWWDTLFLDILLGNLLGMLAGIACCRYLEVKRYYWRSFKELPTRTLQIKRAVQQFTPASWTLVRWAPLRSVKRYLQVCVIIFLNQIVELNSFFLKTVFEIPAVWPGNHYRLILWTLMCLPALRQSYVYLSDPSCVRLGTQAWVSLGAMITETLIWVKFGFLSRQAMWDINDLFKILLLWIPTLMVFTFLCLYLASLLGRIPARKTIFLNFLGPPTRCEKKVAASDLVFGTL
eukprot:GEMP01052880.1.p1 GENE.GEMP01052880.1~~GEMP01052880.1.p1  ORF type:complete len:495 (+),score=43.84 GEMP01052880.1:42-1526(+)